MWALLQPVSHPRDLDLFPDLLLDLPLDLPLDLLPGALDCLLQDLPLDRHPGDLLDTLSFQLLVMQAILLLVSLL